VKPAISVTHAFDASWYVSSGVVPPVPAFFRSEVVIHRARLRINRHNLRAFHDNARVVQHIPAAIQNGVRRNDNALSSRGRRLGSRRLRGQRLRCRENENSSYKRIRRRSKNRMHEGSSFFISHALS
jgi:hypothetical protein